MILRNTALINNQSFIFFNEKILKELENQNDDGKEIENEKKKQKIFEEVKIEEKIKESEKKNKKIEKKLENARNIEVQQKQIIVRKKINEKYNKTHQIYIFKIDDIVIFVILFKNKVIIDAFKIKAEIIAMSHEHRYKLRIEYNILIIHYSTNELNSMSQKLLKSVFQKIIESNFKFVTLTFHVAATLKFLFIDVSVKCGCKKNAKQNDAIASKLMLNALNIVFSSISNVKICLILSSNKSKCHLSQEQNASDSHQRLFQRDQTKRL